MITGIIKVVSVPWLITQIKFIVLIAGAAKVTIFSTIMWFLLTILFQFVLPSPQGLVFVHVCGAMFMILPPLNCIRVLLCIRRHNAQLVVAAPSQMTTIFQREKKVALDMCIITVSLFASISPSMAMMLLQIRYPKRLISG